MAMANDHVAAAWIIPSLFSAQGKGNGKGKGRA
jgi:hypothetical protein